MNTHDHSIAELTQAYSASTYLTVLKATKPAVPLTKVFSQEGSKAFPNAYIFNAKQFTIDSLTELYTAIHQLQSQPNTCIIRGCLKGNRTQAKDITRILKDKPERKAEFQDSDSKLLHLDIDGYDSPKGMKKEQWAEYCINMLPVCFRDVSYIYQYSCSAGIKPGIRLHLWFYLTLPATYSELKRWRSHLSDQQQLLVDDAVFRPVQVNYIQNPIFENDFCDPLKGVERLGLIEKQHKTLTIAIPKEELRVVEPLNTDIPHIAQHAGDPMNAFYRKLWQIENSGRLHIPILSAFSAYKWAKQQLDEGASDYYTAMHSDSCEDWAVVKVFEAIQLSPHPDKNGIYSSDEYLENQLRDAQIGLAQK
ncbi:hypothetical protein AB4392_05235 [Vibrio breoganii]